jgi:hypothetical protein
MWETALAGAGWVNQNDTSFAWDVRTSIARRTALRDQAYDATGHCARFFNQCGVKFWEMAPAAELSSTRLCLARAGHEYIIYAPTGGRFSVDLSAATGTTLKVRWYNPRSGKFHPSTPTHGGNQAQVFEAPFSGDAVLHIAA